MQKVRGVLRFGGPNQVTSKQFLTIVSGHPSVDATRARITMFERFGCPLNVYGNVSDGGSAFNGHAYPVSAGAGLRWIKDMSGKEVGGRPFRQTNL